MVPNEVPDMLFEARMFLVSSSWFPHNLLTFPA
jgi:hypothetical protein